VAHQVKLDQFYGSLWVSMSHGKMNGVKSTTFAPCDETGSVSDKRADLRVDLRSVAGVINYSMHGFGSRI
jgi:hypothetical protein